MINNVPAGDARCRVRSYTVGPIYYYLLVCIVTRNIYVERAHRNCIPDIYKPYVSFVRVCNLHGNFFVFNIPTPSMGVHIMYVHRCLDPCPKGA